MRGEHRTSPEMRDKIVEMREAGTKVPAIARNLGVSIGTVQHHCLLNAADPPGGPRPTPRRREGPILRGGRTINPFTQTEDARLREMDRDGLNYSEISRAMTAEFPDRPRNPATIKYRFATLARQERRAEGAS